MANEQTLAGNWNEIKGEAQKKWGQLTDDDLDRVEGNMTQLVGLIQRKTGEARESVDKFLSQFTNGAASTFSQMAETAKDYAGAAAENVSDVAQHAVDQVKAGYMQTERVVRRHPVESMAVCFGVGVITGVVASLLMRR